MFQLYVIKKIKGENETKERNEEEEGAGKSDLFYKDSLTRMIQSIKL